MEIRGKINDQAEALLSLKILGTNGFIEVETVIDTGFDGDLVLPPEVIENLHLPFIFRADIRLVGETTKATDFFHGQIEWFGTIRKIDIIADEAFLIGTNLLREAKILIDYPNEILLLEK